MSKYKINGEKVPANITGAKTLVKYMRETAKNPSADIQSYMFDYALWSVIHRRIDIRTTDEGLFVNDLIMYGDVVELR